jgi:hypothetical protein
MIDKTKAKPAPTRDAELSDAELDIVVGGINPQPLPPRSPRM